MDTTTPATRPIPHQPASPFANPTSASLTLRVSKVLSGGFEDPGTRAALQTLSTLRGGRGQLGGAEETGKDEKVDLKHFERGGLRREVEAKIAERSREFLALFSEVNDRLSELQGHLDEMHQCCDDVQAKLESANSGTRHLLEHADGLRRQSATTSTQQALATLFLARFTLSQAEIQCLTSRELAVDRSLFSAMDHCLQIRDDCAVLLAASTETAGMDIMTTTSEYLDKGYEKLFRWCSFECRGVLSRGGEVTVEVPSLMKEAIKRLKQRPDMLEEILTLLSSTRSTSMLNVFQDALIRGGPSGLPRPIELHAHDPIRYIGDMLAWVHQAMASEHEFLESLFDLKGENRRVGEPRVFSPQPQRSDFLQDPAGLLSAAGYSDRASPGPGDRQRVRTLLDKDMEGCARPLRMRVLQTVKSQEGSLIIYEIATLIHFYKITMDRTIGPDALLSKTLSEITDVAYEAFFQNLEAQGRSLVRFVQPPPADLSAPAALREALTTLREIAAVYSTSLVEDALSPRADPDPGPNPAPTPLAAPADEPPVDFGRVLDAALDPALKMCELMARQRPQSWDQSVFLINCLAAALSTLEPFVPASERRVALSRSVDSHVAKLVEEHFGGMLRDSGLQPIVDTIAAATGTPLSRIEATSPARIAAAARRFDGFLAGLDALTSPRLTLLASAKTAGEVHRRALRELARAYGAMWDAVMDERNRYEFRASLLTRSKEEVHTLLA